MFARPLKDYQAVYETKERQLKNWVAVGRKAQPEDLPPLDRPAEMPAWWARHYDRVVPEKLTLAATKANGQQAADVPPAPQASTPEKAKGEATPPPAPPTNPRERIGNFDDLTGLSLEAAVERLRKALAVVVRDYEQALGNPDTDESTLSMRANRVDKAMERLRKMETTLDEIRKSREELIDRTLAEEDLRRVHTAMASSLETSIVDRFKIERAAVRTFVDTWFGTLRQSRFFSNAGPAASAPVAA